MFVETAVNVIKSFDVFDLVFKTLLKRTAEKAQDEKETFTAKLEAATGEDIFKYILLIQVSALDGYVAQTRLQAQHSFRLCRLVALVGFVLLISGIVFGFYTSVSKADRPMLDAAYLSSAAGLISEFIASVFFYLYNRTLQQINRFHDRLIAMQQTSMSFLATGLVQDALKRDEAKLRLADALLTKITIGASELAAT
jgi:hypothetical protein